MPVRDFLGDDSGDMAVVNGDFAFAGGDTVAENHQAVLQGIQCRTRMFLGECYLDESVGVDWLGKILIKGYRNTDVTLEISNAINSTPDVVASSIQTPLDVTPQRTATIAFTVQDSYSSNTLAGTISPPLVPSP